MSREEFIRLTTNPTGVEYFIMATVGIPLPKRLKFGDDLSIVYSPIAQDVDDTGDYQIKTTGVKKRGILIKRTSLFLGWPAYHSPEHVANYRIFQGDPEY